MTIQSARTIEKNFYQKNTHTEEEEFMFIEAMKFLISEENLPRDMMSLGGYYYEIKSFDLALKYYEMAETFDYLDAYICLGYIWYYGRTGEKDYKKAFHYYSKAMEKGDIVSSYKVADMYKNGYFVEKNYDKYVEIIESLYPKVKNAQYVNEPLPEVFTRLANIRRKNGENTEAEILFLQARDCLAKRIRYNPFFGNLSIMKWLIQDLYTVTEFDPYDFWLYDLYYILKTPNVVTFRYNGEKFKVSSMMENDECIIQFDDNQKPYWYRNIDDFFMKAKIGDKLLTEIYYKLHSFEVEEWN